MRILIISDTHKKHTNLETVLGKIGKLDMLLHLGDVEGYEDYIGSIAECPIRIIAGNNDFFSSLEREWEFSIGKYKVFMTHGNAYRVSLGMEYIKEEAIARKADIVMFGHTHKPIISIENEVTILNPGSISFPRQEGRQGSYILMELDNKGEAHFTINFV